MYNIRDKTGRLMLGSWLPYYNSDHTRMNAVHWLSYYKRKVGCTYPNGNGRYPDLGYHIVQRTPRGIITVP